MKPLCEIREFFWPILEPTTVDQQKKDDTRLHVDGSSIASLPFTHDGAAMLDEARRFADAENERWRGADQKASTYLAVVAALVPLIVTVATAIWDKKAGSAPPWLNMLLLGTAVAYATCAGWWAFRVLKVSALHVMGVGDFAAAAQKREPAHELTKRILLNGRLNQAGVNQKISRIRMTHAFLLRAFISFASLLIFNILWYVGMLGWQNVSVPREPWLESSARIVAAASEVDRLAESVETKPAWQVLDARCRAQSGGQAVGLIVGGIPKRAVSVPRALRIAGQTTYADEVLVRKVRVECAKINMANLEVWYRPSGLPPTARKGDVVHLFGLHGQSASDITVKRFWPTDDPSAAMTAFPPILLQQTSMVRSQDGDTIVVVSTEILPAALGPIAAWRPQP